jgi:hypothetical protein
MSLSQSSPDLPRLLYIADVPVENTRSGSVQLYRLLRSCPVKQLRVIESNLFGKNPPLRLPDVHYDAFTFPTPRLLRTRIGSAYTGYLFLTAAWRARAVCAANEDWKPGAVLTVANHYSWLTAAAVARRLQVPLHLIIHDDPVNSMYLPKFLTGRGERAFAEVYRQAVTRLCVCPAMAELYTDRYGLPAGVMYPVHDPLLSKFDEPPARLGRDAEQLTFAYAGTVVSQGYVHALATLAGVLGASGHRLLLFSNWDAEVVRKNGLDRPDVTIRPLAGAGKLVSELRDHADVLFAPMSFDPADQIISHYSFPSKLTDYTAAGLPLLVWGPPDCSAVRWSVENPGAAEVVDNPSPDALIPAVRALTNPLHRLELARNAIRLGNQFFSSEGLLPYLEVE